MSSWDGLNPCLEKRGARRHVGAVRIQPSRGSLAPQPPARIPSKFSGIHVLIVSKKCGQRYPLFKLQPNTSVSNFLSWTSPIGKRTMPRVIQCIASGHGTDWEAFCLDYDLAVQGRSFEEVRLSLAKAIDMYLDSALAEPEPLRTRLLARRAPFRVRLMWAWRVFWSTLAIHAARRDSYPATVEFVACPA